MITPQQYIDEITDAVGKKVLRHTAQIYRFVEKTKRSSSPYEAIGSAVLIKLNDRFFLVTAGHIINENNIGKIGFFEINTFHILYGNFIYTNPDFDKESKYTDLAICELDIESKEFLTKHFDFIDGTKLNFDYQPKNDKNFLIVGFPWRKTKFNFVKQKIKVIPFKFLTNIYKSKQISKEIESYRDQIYLLSYPQRQIIEIKSGQKKRAVTPDGLSGCGIWHIPDIYVENLNNIVVNLAGIVTRQDEFKKLYIVATKIHIVSELLRLYFDIYLKPSMISRIESTKAKNKISTFTHFL